MVVKPEIWEKLLDQDSGGRNAIFETMNRCTRAAHKSNDKIKDELNHVLV